MLFFLISSEYFSISHRQIFPSRRGAEFAEYGNTNGKKDSFSRWGAENCYCKTKNLFN